MKEIDIQQELLDFTKPIAFYAKFYGVSRWIISGIFKKLGIYDKFPSVKKAESQLLKERYSQNPKRCLQCQTIIPFEKKRNKYCSYRCSAYYTQKDGGHCRWSEEDKKRIREQSKKNPFFNGEKRAPQGKRIKKGVYRKCPGCSKEFYFLRSCYDRKTCSLECAKKAGTVGGSRSNSGRGRVGWFNGYFCQSSWELAWVMYNLDNGINFKRNLKGFDYTFNGIKHKFYPDFVLENGEYVEIKGYLTEKNKAKISQFPEKLCVLLEKDMEFYIKYAKEKYGNDYIKLYKANPNKKQAN